MACTGIYALRKCLMRREARSGFERIELGACVRIAMNGNSYTGILDFLVLIAMKNPLFCLGSLTLTLCFVSFAWGAPSDFNGDGKSDPAAVRITPSGGLRWNALMEDEEIRIAQQFGQLGVHLMAANFRNLGVTDAAYVNENGKWYVSGGETVHSFSHGADKATYMGGADVDGDGIYDAIYHTNTCRKKLNVGVHVLLDPLGRKTAYSIEGGLGNQFTTFGNANGDPFDDFCWLEPLGPEKKPNGRFKMICKDVFTGTIVGNFRVGRVYNRPLPVKTGPKSPTYFAFFRKYKKKQKTVVKIISTQGETVQSDITLNGTGPLLVGDYLGTGGIEQLAIAHSSSFTVYDLASNTYSTITSPEGIAFDEINIEHFDSSLDGCLCTSKKIKRNKTCPGGGGNRCQVKRAVTDGLGNWLHKPVSDSTHSIVNLFPANESPSDCRYETKRGKLIRDAYTSGRTNGNRSTWRPVGGGSCSSFPKNLVVSCVINKKRNCWTIPNPCQRYD